MAIDNIDSRQFDVFVSFATQAQTACAAKEKTVVKTDGILLDGARTVVAETNDKIGAIFRSRTAKAQNDEIRQIFKDSIIEMFGGESRIPESVKKAMQLSDYGKGKPLTARRILAVNEVVSRLEADFTVASAMAKAKIEGTDFYQSLNEEEQARVDELVGVAVKTCIHDKDALDIVTKNLMRILVGGDSHLRSADGVRAKVDAIMDNMDELRALAKKNPSVMAAGRALLDELGGKSIAPGLIGKIVGATSGLKVDLMKKLTPDASGLQLHKAIGQFRTNLQRAMISSGAEKALEGGDELEPCRNFVANLLLAKCGEASIAKMRQAFGTEKMTKLYALYNSISMGLFNMKDYSAGYNSMTKDQAGVCAKFMNALKFALDLRNGVTAKDFKDLEEFNGKFDPKDIDGAQVLDRVLGDSKARMIRERKEFMDQAVQGDSEGAKLLRNVYSARIGPEPYSPLENLQRQTEKVTVAKLNWSLATACKKLANGKLSDTAFAKDVVRPGMEFRLPGGVVLPRNVEQAREELAKFIAGDRNATYEGLDPTSKNKVHIVIALLSQETAKAGFDGHATALDPKMSTPKFIVGGDQHRDTRVFSLSLGKDGSLNLSFEGKQDVAVLQTDEGYMQTGPGSTIEMSFTFKIEGDEFNRLAQVDFSTFDDTAANAVLDDASVVNSHENAVKAFGKDFQFGYKKTVCHATFGATIN